LPRRRDPDPHIRFVDLSSGSKHAAAARALGLGAPLTTLYLQSEKEAEATLPPNFHSYALLPIGYPMGRFGPVRRVPLVDVVYEDRWGQPYRDL
jgi:nitroreductase